MTRADRAVNAGATQKCKERAEAGGAGATSRRLFLVPSMTGWGLRELNGDRMDMRAESRWHLRGSMNETEGLIEHRKEGRRVKTNSKLPLGEIVWLIFSSGTIRWGWQCSPAVKWTQGSNLGSVPHFLPDWVSLNLFSIPENGDNGMTYLICCIRWAKTWMVLSALLGTW